MEKIPNKTDILTNAESFNAKLCTAVTFPTNLPEVMFPEYYSSLDIMGNGMIGYISVPDEDILLPSTARFL